MGPLRRPTPGHVGDPGPLGRWTLGQVDRVLAGRAGWPRHLRDQSWWDRTNHLLERRLELTAGRGRGR
jgi:hypothetical protein